MTIAIFQTPIHYRCRFPRNAPLKIHNFTCNRFGRFLVKYILYIIFLYLRTSGTGMPDIFTWVFRSIVRDALTKTRTGLLVIFFSHLAYCNTIHLPFVARYTPVRESIFFKMYFLFFEFFSKTAFVHIQIRRLLFASGDEALEPDETRNMVIASGSSSSKSHRLILLVC